MIHTIGHVYMYCYRTWVKLHKNSYPVFGFYVRIHTWIHTWTCTQCDTQSSMIEGLFAFYVKSVCHSFELVVSLNSGLIVIPLDFWNNGFNLNFFLNHKNIALISLRNIEKRIDQNSKHICVFSYYFRSKRWLQTKKKQCFCAKMLADWLIYFWIQHQWSNYK